MTIEYPFQGSGFVFEHATACRGQLLPLPGGLEVRLAGAGWGPSLVGWDVEYLQAAVAGEDLVYTRVCVGAFSIRRMDAPNRPWTETRASRWRLLSVRNAPTGYIPSPQGQA